MDVNVTNDDGYTCLMKAAYTGEIEVVNYLAQLVRADLSVRNSEGDTALVIASRNGKIEVIRYLAEQCGADINVANREGFTALSVAAADGDTNIARYLADGCRAAVRDGKSAPMRAAENGRIEIVQYLVEKCGADVDVKDNDGNTALMKAAENGKLEVVQYLGKHCRVDLNATTNDGCTALIKAVENGYTAIVRYLVEQCGADVHSKSKILPSGLLLIVVSTKFNGYSCHSFNHPTKPIRVIRQILLVIALFRYLQDKDVFEEFYKVLLAKRLLNSRGTSDEAEKLVISKLKAECGYQFTSKLEGMFKDMSISKDLMELYRKSGCDSRGSGFGIDMSVAPMPLSVHVLTSGFWPAEMAPMCALPWNLSS